MPWFKVNFRWKFQMSSKNVSIHKLLIYCNDIGSETLFHSLFKNESFISISSISYATGDNSQRTSCYLFGLFNFWFWIDAIFLVIKTTETVWRLLSQKFSINLVTSFRKFCSRYTQLFSFIWTRPRWSQRSRRIEYSCQ